MENAWLTGQPREIFPSCRYNSEDTSSFFSGCWNTGTDLELALASEDLNSSELDRHTLNKFPGSQHRPLLIMASKNLALVPSECRRVGTSARLTGNYMASSQTSYLRN